MALTEWLVGVLLDVFASFLVPLGLWYLVNCFYLRLQAYRLRALQAQQAIQAHSVEVEVQDDGGYSVVE